MNLEIRYANLARRRDALYAGILAGIPAGLASSLLQKQWEYAETWHVFPMWAVAAAVAVSLVGLWRWRIRGRLDEKGISVQPAADEPADELAWSEVEEIFLESRQGFELRGGGRAVRVPPDVEGFQALGAEMRRLAAPVVRKRLRARLEEGAPLSFRGPRSAATSWAWWGLAWLILAFFAANGLRSIRGAEGAWAAVGTVGILMLFWFLALRKLLEWTSWLGAEVVVGPDEILIRRLGRVRRIPRSEIREVLTGSGWLDLVRVKGRAIRIPPLPANFGFLAELLRDGRISG